MRYFTITDKHSMEAKIRAGHVSPEPTALGYYTHFNLDFQIPEVVNARKRWISKKYGLHLKTAPAPIFIPSVAHS